MKRETITELQALQNAVDYHNLTDLKIHEKYFEDKRKTTKMYFLHNEKTGETISPVLDYENLNHFIHGYTKAFETYKKKYSFIQEMPKEITVDWVDTDATPSPEPSKDNQTIKCWDCGENTVGGICNCEKAKDMQEGFKLGDILQVTQGKEIHYERVIQIEPEILTIDMNEYEMGDISTQGLSNAAGISYEVMPNWKIAAILKNSIPRAIAFSIANRFYGSDYNMQQSTFDNAAKELGY